MPRKKLTEEEKKSKITVYVNENLLQKLNDLDIKGNRSDFIEKILIEYLKDK